MTLRIETLENSEKNRATKEDEKAEEAEQPMIMAPQLMLANSAHMPGMPGAPVSVLIFSFNLSKFAEPIRSTDARHGPAWNGNARTTWNAEWNEHGWHA